jgi:hypothetical protein
MLLGQVQLAALFPTGPATKWLSGEITQDRTPDLRAYLMNELEVEEVDSDGFARKISHAFLSTQSDEWFVTFYRYLSSQEALWRAPRWPGDSGVGVLRSRPILRLQDERLEAPFAADGRANAYLPPAEGTDLPAVKKTIAENEHAAAFLKRLGLDEPNIFDDIVHRVLPKYTRQTVSVSSDEHAADIQKLFRALASDSEGGKKKVLEEASKTPCLKAYNCAGQTAYKRPCEIYHDEGDLRLYFEGFAEAWFLDETLPEDLPGGAICSGLGVARGPRRVMFSGELPPEIRKYWTRYETIVNYKLDGFDNFVETLKADANFATRKQRSLVLWRYLSEELHSSKSFFLGTYKWFYYDHHSVSFDSFMLTQLRQTEWIPVADGALKKPTGLPAEELSAEFRDADDLMTILRLNTEDLSEASRRSEQAAELGVSLEDIEFLRAHQEDFQAWRQSLAERAAKPAFPVRKSTDPARRATRVSEQWQDAREKEYALRERSVRISRDDVDPHHWLIDCYTNDDGQMICQLCGNEMPFKKRNEEYYFVAMEALGREQFLREHRAQFLALCPVCAAKYNEFVKSAPETLVSMKSAILEADEPAIPVKLGNAAETLRFVEVHLDDLKTILREDGSGSG